MRHRYRACPGLADSLDGKVCVLGVGSRRHGDDAVGPLLVDALRERTHATLIDAGTVVENYLEAVARSRPDTVLIVDATDFGGTPGEARVLDPQAVHAGGLSTHASSLGVIAGYLQARTGARLVVLGVQPCNLDMDTKPSAAVTRALARLRDEILTALELAAARTADSSVRSA